MPVSCDRVVLIGASAGGVHALLEIAQRLPAFFPAPVCIVQHIGNHDSLLPELLKYRGPNHAMHAQDGQGLTPGTLYIAPPDRHLLLAGDRLHLTFGPKENHARPAIDPLFRSAAIALGSRAIGVVLTGQMDDGTAGLKAIKACGGVAIVQDPATAAEPEMPRSAMQFVEVDHCVPLGEIAALLVRLVGAPTGKHSPPVPEHVVREVAINRGGSSMEEVAALGHRSPLGCPDCGGALWEMKEGPPLRYRCHTGHAYSSLSLAHAQKERSEHALWSSVRALREREMLLRRMAGISASLGEDAQAAAGQAQAERVQRQANALQEFVESVPPDLELDAPA